MSEQEQWRTTHYQPKGADECANPANKYVHMWHLMDGESYWCPLCGAVGSMAKPPFEETPHARSLSAAEYTIGRLEADLAAAKALIATLRQYVEAYRMIEQIDHDFDTAGPEYDEPKGEVYGKRYSDLIHARALARQDAEESMIAAYDAYALLLEAKEGETP